VELPFRHIVVAHFEFEFGGHDSIEAAGRSGERPRPVCMVAKELRSNQTWRLWRGDFESAPPFPISADSLFVSYYSSAELGCFISLGWPMPANILDLYVEFRDRTNGLTTPAGASLIGALAYFGIDTIGVTEKDAMRKLVLAGGPWSADDRFAIFEYCAGDVLALERLLPAMAPRIDLPRALLRGRYMKAAAAVEWNGVSIDVETLALMRENWEHIQLDLITAIDANYVCFDGRSFRADRWAHYLAEHQIPWPRLKPGRLDLSDDAFRQMAKAYPAVSPMRELRSALSELRLNDLAVGSDGRNRTILSAFRSRTGRNQPSSTKFIFGPSVWLRSLIQPPPSHGLAYIDWSQQEFGVAAALSGDEAMMTAYRSGDPYLEFAKQAGAVPPNATKRSHGPARELFKQTTLATQYGMEATSLAARIGRPPIVARDLLRAHRQTYRTFWRWSDAAVDYAMLTGSLHTVFGWHVHVGDNPNPRSLRNFPMQANGAEMLRLAATFATERGVEVCALIHDAVLVGAPLERLENDIAKMRSAMAEASRIVLAGLELRTDVMRMRHPDRFCDPRGAAMWGQVMKLITKRQNMPASATTKTA
jgi:DNA polymerase family A